MIRCANAGVSRLQVAGSLRRSYTAAEKVSYTARLLSNASRFAGVVADRCVSVGGEPTLDIVDSTGADELDRLKNDDLAATVAAALPADTEVAMLV